ncbi:MAG: chitobiase/beta-hexosaminidase C-terminal domain-containing protein, partial [bacterium]
MAVLWLALLTLGVVGLATGVLPHAWAGMKGSSAAGFLNWWPAQSVRAQGNGGTFTTFEAKDAGTGALQGTFGTSINAAGDIAGVYVTPPNVAHGFVRAAATGAITEFDVSAAGTATNQGTFPASINAGGDIAGMYFDSNNAYHGFVRAGATGTITEFDVPGAPTTSGHRGTIPLSINTAGSITGFYSDSGTVRHGFVRTIVDGTPTFTSFDVPGAGSSATQGTVPLSINAAGDITGCYVDANQVFHGFIRIAATGTITAPINAPGAGTSPSKKGISFSGTVATSIDAGGEITGVYADTNGIHHGFVRAASGTITDPIDAPGAGTAGVLPGTLPASINDSGIITGAYEDASGVTHGFVRAADGTITAPLDAPGASTSGMASGTAALSINATGQMTGTYVDANVVFHGYLFTPSSTPPPAAAPTFNPVAGTYTSPQSVTLADTTPGAVMYYTTDGGTPTPGMAGTNQYAGAIQVSSTETIKAIATATGFSNSSMASATYTINLPTPDFLVTVNPTTLTIVAGQSGMATFTVTPENGFNSQVST